MLRHATGHKLANEGRDTRALQHYLGHKNISKRPLATAALPAWRRGADRMKHTVLSLRTPCPSVGRWPLVLTGLAPESGE